MPWPRKRAGAGPQDITLLAATKTVPLEVINHAIDSGLSAMGENRVQELLEKYDGLHREKCDIQFIGQLQTNKVKYLVGKVSCIQSVGSVKLAKEISRLCLREGATMKVLVEVNIGREESKGGVLPEALFEVVDEIRTLPGLHVDEHFGNADAVPQLPERCLSRKAGIVRCCLGYLLTKQKARSPAVKRVLLHSQPEGAFLSCIQSAAGYPRQSLAVVIAQQGVPAARRNPAHAVTFCQLLISRYFVGKISITAQRST